MFFTLIQWKNIVYVYRHHGCNLSVVVGKHWNTTVRVAGTLTCLIAIVSWTLLQRLHKTVLPQSLICRHFYSVYPHDAVLQHLFCPAEFCVCAMCCETWRSQPPLIVIDLCCCCCWASCAIVCYCVPLVIFSITGAGCAGFALLALATHILWSRTLDLWKNMWANPPPLFEQHPFES